VSAVVEPSVGRRVAVAAPSTTVVLVRHGQTVWHADNRYAGAGNDIDLTATGQVQVRQLAAWAARRRPDAVVCSPVRRAVETARPSADVTGKPLQMLEDLREVGFGMAEGHTLDELRARDPEMVRRFRDDPVRHPFPGAESPLAAAARCAAVLRVLATARPGGTILVVAHNTVLRLGMCSLLDLPVRRYRQLFPRLDNAAVSEIRLPVDPAEPASLLSLNDRLDALPLDAPPFDGRPVDAH